VGKGLPTIKESDTTWSNLAGLSKSVQREKKMNQDFELPLVGCRALDLADEKGFLCGKLLADLGVDVIKIEKANDESARRIGPFPNDDIAQQTGLYWLAFNVNKRGITLNIENRDGQEVFRRLVKTADFVIESYPPGYLDGLGNLCQHKERTALKEAFFINNSR